MKIAKPDSDRWSFIVVITAAFCVILIAGKDSGMHWPILPAMCVLISAVLHRLVVMQKPQYSAVIGFIIIAVIIASSIFTNGLKFARVAGPEVCLFALAAAGLSAKDRFRIRTESSSSVRERAMEFYMLLGFALGIGLISVLLLRKV